MLKKSKGQFLEKYKALGEKENDCQGKKEYYSKLRDTWDDRIDDVRKKKDELIQKYIKHHAIYPRGTRFKLKNGVGLEVMHVDGDYNVARSCIQLSYQLGYNDNYDRHCIRYTESELRKEIAEGRLTLHRKDDWWLQGITVIKTVEAIDIKTVKQKLRWNRDPERMYKDSTFLLHLEGGLFAKVTYSGFYDLRSYEDGRLTLDRDNNDVCTFKLFYKAPRKRTYRSINVESFKVDVVFKTKEEAVLSLI